MYDCARRAIEISAFAGLVLWIWSSARPARAAEELRTVAMTGEIIPQFGPGVTFKSFDRPSMSRKEGWTAFSAVIQGMGVNSTNDTALFSEAGGSLRPIAREGDTPLVGDPALKLRDLRLELPYARDTGSTIIQSQLLGGTAPWLMWRVLADGTFEQVALEGQPGVDPSLLVGRTVGFGTPNDLGHANFLGSVSGPGIPANAIGPWIEGPAGMEILAYNGGTTPLGSGIVVNGISGALLNDQGEATFTTRLSGSGITSANESALWFYGDAGLELLVRGGDIAPGTNPSQPFRNISNGRLNNKGEVIFSSGLTDNSEGIWTNRGGVGFEMVLRSGTPAPGTPAGTVFGFTPTGGTGSIVFNDSGAFAVLGALDGPGVTPANEVGVFSDVGGQGLKLIARMGDPAPGTSPSTVFANLRTFEGLAFNNRGQLALRSGLTGPDVVTTNDVGIWAQDRNGVLRLIARTGDLLDISDDPLTPDFRMISFLEFLDGIESTLNDAGEVAFYARFTDGSEGVFVSSVAAIPEPTSLISFGIGLLVFVARVRPQIV